MLKSERKQVILETVIKEKFVSLDYLVHSLKIKNAGLWEFLLLFIRWLMNIVLN